MSGRRAGVLPIALLSSVGFAAAVFSLPRFAADHAVACKQCHINPTGGGPRNEFGNHAVAFQELCIPPTKKLLASHYKKPRVSDAVLVGFDSRWLVFHERQTFRMQSDFYLTVTPFHNFDFVSRIGPFGGNPVISEQYALLRFNDTKYWIKAGTFQPAFGLGIDDHTAFVRSETGHPPVSFWDGVSVGADIHDVNIVAEAFSKDLRGIFNLHAFRTGFINPIGYIAGLSWQQSERYQGTTGDIPRAKALFGGLNWDRFTVLGEYDAIGSHNDSMAVYGSATARLVWGCYLTGEYNFFDPDRHLQSGTEKFTRISLDLYPVPFVNLRPSYSHYNPQHHGKTNEFFLQVHVGY